MEILKAFDKTKRKRVEDMLLSLRKTVENEERRMNYMCPPNTKIEIKLEYCIIETINAILTYKQQEEHIQKLTRFQKILLPICIQYYKCVCIVKKVLYKFAGLI